MKNMTVGPVQSCQNLPSLHPTKQVYSFFLYHSSLPLRLPHFISYPRQYSTSCDKVIDRNKPYYCHSSPHHTTALHCTTLLHYPISSMDTLLPSSSPILLPDSDTPSPP